MAVQNMIDGQSSEYWKTGSLELIKFRYSGVYLILFLILIPFLSFAQPGNPTGDTDNQINPIQTNVFKNPGTVIDVGDGGINELWINSNFARTQDDAYATLTTTTKNKRTNYLMAQNFGFNIPAGSSIDGIVVEVDRFATAVGGEVTDSRIRIVNAAGKIGNEDKSTGLIWPTSDTDTYQSYGGATDTWDITTWTSAQINNTNFGVVLAAETSNDNNVTFNLFVDEIRITVYYTTGGAERYAVATGNWNSTSSWSTSPGGAPGATVPTTSNDVFIGGGFTITQNVNGATCNSLNIGTSEANPLGRLTFDANGRNISIGVGGLDVTSNGNVLSTFTPTLTVAGDVTINAVLTNRSFLIKIDGTTSGILSGSGTLGRLNVQTVTTHTGTITITAEITGSSLRLVNESSGYLTYSGTTSNMDTDVLSLLNEGNTVEFSQTTTNTPDFNIQKASDTFYNLVISGNAPKIYNGDITIHGDLTITTTGILSNQGQNGITLFGNWTNNNGAAGFVPNTGNGSTVIFRGGNATITNAAGEQFHRVEVFNDAGAILTAANNIIIDNQLLMTTGAFAVGSNSLTGTASLVMNGGALFIGTTGTLVPELTGSYTLVSGIIFFNGDGPQTIRSTTSTPAITAYKTVEFRGSGTKSLSGPIVVDTDVRISGSATLDVTASNFGINNAGDWTNISSFIPRSGTVTLNSIGTQRIINPAGEVFHNLTINNSSLSSAVILNDPVTVNGLMTFTDGHVISSDTSLLTLGPDATVASVSDASHVAGPVAKIKNTTAVFAFPIGTGTNYMPTSITPTSTTSTTFEAEYFSLEQSVGTTEAGIDHVSAQDYWTIERTNGTADAAVTLVWEYPSAADAEINNLPDLLVAQWDGTNWVSRGNAGTTGTFVAGSVQSNTITSFTQPYFVIGSSTSNNPLSNFRYFAALSGNWNSPGVWAYRLGGPTIAPEPTGTKYVIIQEGNSVTILDSPSAQATKSMKSLSVLGTIVFANSAGQDITVNVGKAGFTLGASGNITGDDIGDEIVMDGSISLDNTSAISHTVLETSFATEGNTITGTGGSLPILNANRNNQTFIGITSFTDLTIGSDAINDGTVTITGVLSGGGTLTNGATGTIVWQGTDVSGGVIDATTPGNTIQLVNNTSDDIDIDDFVSASTFGHLILGGTNNFTLGADASINGDLTILSGAAVSISSGNNDLNISGNWTNNGTFNATSGTVVFLGTTTIGGSSISSFNHIVISDTLISPSVFNVRGNFTNDGIFVADEGTVVFNGTNTQSISGILITTFNNISVTNSSGTVQVQSTQNMTGVLTLSANAVFDADGSTNTRIFTLLSSADNPTQDASIATLPTGASVTGQVTVQRYMSVEGSNGRIYRYISPPVQNALVSQIQAFIPVTGTFAGSSICSGCGASQSMFSYDEAVITDTNGSGAPDSNDGYINFPAATNTETFSPGRGYSIFVRGNIAPIAPFDSVVWSLRGPINSGNVNLPVTFTSSGTVANDGWNLVGNPYPSTIDWDAAGWTRTNLNNTTYMLDNGLASPVYATHVAGGASTNGGSRYIATGQAFFVKSTGGSPSLQATESVKASGTQTTYFRTKGIEDIMRVTLRQGTKADETVIQFKPDATADFDLNSDAHKLDNPTPMYSLATLTNGVRYVINALPAPTTKTEVRLDIAYTTAGSYSMEFTEFESFADDLMPIMLRDDFFNTEINIRINPKYAFQVTSDARSFGNARFTIVFGKEEVVTGIELDASHITVYPNPTKSIVNVEVRSDKDVHAKIVSVTGTTLFELPLQGGRIKKGSFNLEEQTDGMYILMVQEGAQLFVKKILKR